MILLQRCRAQLATLSPLAPIGHQQINMPPAERARIKLEAFDWVVSKERKDAEAKLPALLHRGVRYPFAFRGMAPVVALQDQRQNVFPALWLKG